MRKSRVSIGKRKVALVKRVKPQQDTRPRKLRSTSKARQQYKSGTGKDRSLGSSQGNPSSNAMDSPAMLQRFPTALEYSTALAGRAIDRAFQWQRDVETLFTRSTDLKLETDELCLEQIARLSQKILTADEDDQTDGLNVDASIARTSGLLQRTHHVQFLMTSLEELPAAMVGLDASRPWMLYWCLNAMSLMRIDLELYRPRLVKTLRAIQNPTGGFGGGFGQYSHLATTYAATLSLIVAGGDECLDLIDRKAMWEWLGSLKKIDGSFSMSLDAEVDTRAAYCVMTLVTLLNLPLELPHTAKAARDAGMTTFTDHLAEWVASCQTYQGGLGSVPGAEAHGAYTFCALACLCLIGEPRTVIAETLDMETLISWLVHRQDNMTGGLAGRTNKLVDGCYSSWIGGCFALVEAAMKPVEIGATSVPTVWEPRGLIQYIFSCAQSLDRCYGLRDKPGMRADQYHTNYNLLGLASAQTSQGFDAASDSSAERPGFRWKVSSRPREDDTFDRQLRSPSDDLDHVSPVFNIPMRAVDIAQKFYQARPL